MGYSLKILCFGSYVSSWGRESEFCSGRQNHRARASSVWIYSLFGLRVYLYFEDVLGWFGGMNRLYFSAQLERVGQHERRWVAPVGSVQDKQYREAAVGRKRCDLLFKGIKNQSCSSRNSNRITCKALWCPSGSCKVKYFQRCLSFAMESWDKWPTHLWTGRKGRIDETGWRLGMAVSNPRVPHRRSGTL